MRLQVDSEPVREQARTIGAGFFEELGEPRAFFVGQLGLFRG